MSEALHSAFLQFAFDRLASPQVVDFFRQRKLDEKLLDKLKRKLRSIDALADDAEQKQLRDRGVRCWLLEVKDAVFDAEDLLAEIDFEHTRSQVEAEYKVPNIIDSTLSSFNSKIGSGMKEVHSKIVSGMKEVLGKLENLASQKSDLGLEKATNLGVGSGSKVSQKLESTHLVVENVIYGRDYDEKIIFDWLTSKTDNHNQLSILSVVGMGGLGKTTLAQHVFNDPRVEDLKFDVKAWVCVSDDFDVLKVTRTILEEITDSRDDSRNLGMVHRRLKEKLSGKKFLLVLDDVWIERQKECEAVLTPLKYGAPGSRILVTTRNESVAFNMRSCKVHHLRQLEGDDCWQVFAEHAFQDDHRQLDSEINEIATKIVAKCNGLPLALASIGSLLHTKSSIAEWRSVLLSNIWDLKEENSEIIPALFLSYCHLPSYLKRCFAFCALFPKDYEFDKEKLILLWMAEGFLQCPRHNQSPLEVGEIYFDDLLSRSFFQQSSWSKWYFNMHDLHNDLAKYVCGDICSRLGVDTAKGIPKTTRHFSFATKGTKCWDGYRSLTDAKRLRTFIPTDWFGPNDWSCGIPINELLSKFKYLRVLSLSRYSDLEELPEAVSKLKYLCSLDLSGTKIKRLSDSTCLLYNLQILKLNSCRSLEELPSNLHKLTNLCCLEFRDTKVRAMPVLLEKLKNLQVLSAFCVGKSSESSIQQLGGVNLEGELQNIVNPLDALAADLNNKTQLVKLDFFPRLCRLELRGCGNLRMISQERTHSHLKELDIYECHELESLPKRMDILLPSLTELTILDCPKVEMLSEGGLPSNLKSLRLSSYKLMASLKGSLGVNTCLEELVIPEMDEVECFPEEGILPLSLTSLTIVSCSNLKKVEYKGLCHLSSLKVLHLSDCPKLECIPEEGLPKSISTLLIFGCPLVKERCQKPEGQDWPKIAHIQNLFIN